MCYPVQIQIRPGFDPHYLVHENGVYESFPTHSNCAGLIYLLSLLSTQTPLRNPDHHSRPTFEDLTSELATDPKALLSWSQQDKATSSKAAVLGAPLHEGRHLYPDLQQRY